jgi:hypothetical protein
MSILFPFQIADLDIQCGPFFNGMVIYILSTTLSIYVEDMHFANQRNVNVPAFAVNNDLRQT